MLLDGFHLVAVARPAGLSGRRMGGAHLARVGGGARLLRLLGSGSQVSGVSIAAGNAHFVGSWVPIDWHPVSGAEGCGPQVGSVAQGGAGTHVFRPLCWHSLGAP